MKKPLSPAQQVKKAEDEAKREALEKLFALHVRCKIVDELGLPLPVCQFKIPHVPYIYDFAWPEFLLTVEINGGTWTKSGHSTGKGIQRDYTKSNAAVMHGWCPLVFTADDVKDLTAVLTVKGFLTTHTPF